MNHSRHREVKELAVVWVASSSWPGQGAFRAFNFPSTGQDSSLLGGPGLHGSFRTLS